MKLKITFIAYVSIMGVNSVIGLGIKDGIKGEENDYKRMFRASNRFI
tara:strand:- start:8 stop:148 length:141 start_codon:yes stop_codon:yes gene_type:complete